MSKRRSNLRLQSGCAGVAVEMLEARRLLTTIDVMVLYSSDTLASLGGTDASAQKAIRQSIDTANFAHLNTADNVVLRLVYTAQINYTSSGSQDTDLNRLQATSDGFIDQAHTLRNTYGADLVALVVSAGAGGLGFEPPTATGDPATGFCVLSPSSVGPGSTVLAHEFGHNMGAGHERDNASQPAAGVFSYSYGYHATGAHGTEYGDVMSYAGTNFDGVGLPVFSTPTVTHDGVAMGKPAGDPLSADVRTTFLNMAPIVANYRATVVADAAPSATLWQTDLSGDQLTFQVRYMDDVGVSAASLGDADVYVQTPEGYQLSAKFVGVDTDGDGQVNAGATGADAYARAAYYRVTLPANLPAVSSLGFYVQTGQVRDTNNVAVPAGLLAANVDGDVTSAYSSGSGAKSVLANARDTGKLVAGDVRQITNSVGTVNDFRNLFRFTLDAAMNVSLAVSGIAGGLASDPTLFVYRDSNLNELLDSGETLGNSFEIGTADRTKSLSLTAGTYYAYIQLSAGHAATNYSLTLRTAAPTPGDVTPPTAILDAADTTTTKSTVDFTVLYRDDNGLDAGSVASAKIDVLLGGPLTGNNYPDTAPISSTVIDSKTILATYQLNFGSFTLPANTTVSARISPSSTLKDGNGNNIVTGGTLGFYTVAPSASDSADPTGFVYSAPQIVVPNGAAPSTYTIVVAYKDNRGISTATLGAGDIQVTGPHSFSQTATYVGTSLLSAGGGIRLATYTITAPGGAWDYTDNGSYTVSVVAAQVKDINNRNLAAGSIGTFTAHVGFPGDASFDNSVDLNDLIRLANNYGQAGGAGWADGDFNFDGVVNLNDLIILANNYGSTAPAEAVADSFAADTPAEIRGEAETVSAGDSTTPPLIAPNPLAPAQFVAPTIEASPPLNDSKPEPVAKVAAAPVVTPSIKKAAPPAVATGTKITPVATKVSTAALVAKTPKPVAKVPASPVIANPVVAVKSVVAVKPVAVVKPVVAIKPATAVKTVVAVKPVITAKPVVVPPKLTTAVTPRKTASIFSEVRVANVSGAKAIKPATARLGK